MHDEELGDQGRPSSRFRTSGVVAVITLAVGLVVLAVLAVVIGIVDVARGPARRELARVRRENWEARRALLGEEQW
jgi:hypothetical protein